MKHYSDSIYINVTHPVAWSGVRFFHVDPFASGNFVCHSSSPPM